LPRFIEEAVNSSAVLVALIGREWATLTDEDGGRRLNNPDDFVRFEVKAALERGVRVIPVLVDGASPLRQQELPADLHKLARLNALKLSYDRYQDDANRLFDIIRRVLEEAEREAREEAELSAVKAQARSAGEAGGAAGAQDRYAALLRARERDFGLEDPDTLATRHNLASSTGQAGDAAGARDQFAALLPVLERVLGPERPNTLIARHSLAYWTGEAGDAAGARDQFAALLSILERVSGPEHPDTLTARNGFDYWTEQAGGRAGNGMK
jgi:hypothetical protein